MRNANGRTYHPDVWKNALDKLERRYLKEIDHSLFGSIVATIGLDGTVTTRVVPGRTASTLSRYGVKLT